MVRHAGVAARVRNKTCYPLGNGLRWTDPEVIVADNRSGEKKILYRFIVKYGSIP